MSYNKELSWMSAEELAKQIRNRELSPVEVIENTLECIEEINPKINAFCTVVPEMARKAAKDAENAVMRGEELGPLHGVPIGIKDDTLTGGILTTSGSRIDAEFVPEEDELIVECLKNAGTIIVGKTNMPEYGYKSSTDNYVFGPTQNPWKHGKNAGGSSGGSAAAVAAGMVPIASGGDGGGSIRIPAALCGVYGVKPGYGRIPRNLAQPFSTANPIMSGRGPMTRTVTDAALTYQAMAGFHPADPYSIPGEIDVMSDLKKDIRGMKVAYSPDLGLFQLDPEVRKACDEAVRVFEDLGCKVEQVDPKFAKSIEELHGQYIEGWYPLYAAEGYEEDQLNLLDPTLKEIVIEGGKILAKDYIKVNDIRNNIWHEMTKIYGKYDLLVSATLSVSSFSVKADGPSEINGNPIEVGLKGPWILTYPFNFTGHPCASIPCGFSDDGMPIGLQLISQRLDESLLFRASYAFEQAKPWNNVHPLLK